MTDRDQVIERVYGYAWGIDTRDWTALRRTFTDEIDVDFSSYNASEPATVPADAWVAGCRTLFSGLDATQHTMTNPVVDIRGDEASCRMYVQAAHFLNNDLGDAEFTLGGYYHDRLVRADHGWLIRSVTLTVLWSRGNRHIMTLAREKGERLLGPGV